MMQAHDAAQFELLKGAAAASREGKGAVEEDGYENHKWPTIFTMLHACFDFVWKSMEYSHRLGECGFCINTS